MPSAVICVCWKENGTVDVPRSKLAAGLLAGETFECLGTLPMDEIASEVCRLFRNVERNGAELSWISDGASHRINLKSSHFVYEFSFQPDKSTQGTIPEFLRLPRLAGRFECILYFPANDATIERPIGSIVRNERNLQSNSLQLNATQLPIEIFDSLKSPKLDQALAVIAGTPNQLQSRTSLLFEEDIENLGQYEIAVLHTNNLLYLLTRNPNDPPGIAVQISRSESHCGDALDHLMVALNLLSADILWKSDTCKFREHEIWRQDDNGNKVMIERVSCLADALSQVRMFSERGHKQLYWTQPN